MVRNALFSMSLVALVCLASQASAQPRAWFGDAGAITLQQSGSIRSFNMLVGQVGPSFLEVNQLQTAEPISQPGTTRFENSNVFSLAGARRPVTGPLPGVPEPAAALAFGTGALLIARRMRAPKR